MLEIFGCVAWEPRSFSVFVRYTLHVTQLWASGAMNFSTASQNISPPIWKRKWFMWQSIRVLGKAMIAEQGSECLDRVWKICQKLRQKIFEDHLRPPPANCFDKQANPTDHKTILQISKYWNRNPLSCMRGNDRFFLEENNCQAIRVKFSRYIVPILGSAKCNQFGCLLWKCHQNFVRQDRAAFTSNYALTENHVDCGMTKFTPIKTLIVHHIGFQGIT